MEIKIKCFSIETIETIRASSEKESAHCPSPLTSAAVTLVELDIMPRNGKTQLYVITLLCNGRFNCYFYLCLIIQLIQSKLIVIQLKL